MMTPLIEFRNVTKSFDDQPVLNRINLQIFEGEITTIIGLSGSGKSVLLKHIIGLLKPDAGSILIRGKPLEEMRKEELATQLSRISYMFQGNALFDSMTVYENIALPLQETTNLAKSTIHDRVMARVRQVELEEAIQRYPSELSGGMQKRVALARALVTDPQIVLFDEPTTGQDPVRKNTILGMIAQYQKKIGFTAILVSHEIPDVYFISNRILALHGREIVFQGSPEELDTFEHPFKDEVIHSLEALQRELTGIYSLRQFRAMHRSQMAPPKKGYTYSLVVFTLLAPDGSALRPEHGLNLELVRSISLLLDKHFGKTGGFTTRRQASEFITALPYSDVKEAQVVIEKFIDNLKASAIPGVYPEETASQADEECSGFSIRIGVAQGHANADIDQVIASARQAQKPITFHLCDPKKKERLQ